MTRQLIEADTVLCVVTETYKKRFNGRELPDVGLGVGWEAGLTRRLLYAQKLHNDRIFPICFEPSDKRHIPLELVGYDYFLLEGPDGYESLLRKLLNRPRYELPQPGPAPELPTQTTEPLFDRLGGSGPVEPSTPAAGPPPRAPLPQRIALSRLLDLGVASRFEELVGREKEHRILDQAWHDRDTHILIFVAAGGVGKTSLITDWMTGFVHNRWQGVDAFFDWSFYSQGTRDQGAANSGQFLDAALRHFGETALADSPAPADTKAERLAERLAEARTLLLLDGVEPLQHPPHAGGLAGRLKDRGLERLLKRLAQLPSAGGLCVLTSRLALVDLNPFHGRGVREEVLDNLSARAAARLLHRAGASQAGAAEIDPDQAPDDRELREAARELDGHALAIQLLGGYLKHAQGGDIRRRDRLDWSRAFDREQEGHVGSLMGAYEHWFEHQGEFGRRQLAVLRLLGCFDRPARLELLDALRTAPAIPGLTEPLFGPNGGLDTEDWNRVLTSLAEDHRLISVRHTGGRIEQVDTHPLIRAWFDHRLQQGNQAAWIEGHRRLYQHLCETTEYRPDSLEGLQPLYQAVMHGCQAGLYEQALYDIYVDRILRGTGHDGFYSTSKLGAVGADLGAVACFFDRLWDRPSPNLSADQAWLLNQAAVRLRALGRLAEALEPMRAGLEMRIEQKVWKSAARIASNLSELELTLGDLAAAIVDAERSVSFADRSQNAFQRMVRRTTQANALQQAGQTDQSRRLFAEAETMQAEQHPQYPRLYSLSGFQYCDLLLADAECAAWRRTLDPQAQIPDLADLQNICHQTAERATEALRIAERHNWLLDIALDQLTLGRVAVYQALLTLADGGHKGAVEPDLSGIHISPVAIDQLTTAVDGIRESGNMDDLPRGLLSRAWQRWLTGDGPDSRKGAVADLDEAWEIAERGSMPLYQADILLTRVRLFGRSKDYPWDSARDDLTEARQLIQKHGYHRRDRELADTKAAFQANGVIGNGVRS
ncbi:ATP-binding protein [Candidatus Thiosymbion oneisti]|uniref:ATP-binding protein n=1 Tax=Candidatus Thiosymbion oneisti TaxID=589554 RepID=UPI00105E9429|nr:ATP-binding protein [Candidatus Thiosymbion oneisti]